MIKASITMVNLSDNLTRSFNPFQYESAQDAISDMEQQFYAAGSTNVELLVREHSDNLPSLLVGDLTLKSQLWDYIEAVESESYSDEIIQAAINVEIPLSDIEELYEGEFADPMTGGFDKEMFGRHLTEEVIESSLPQALAEFFDYERYAEGEIINSYKVSGPHVFRKR